MQLSLGRAVSFPSGTGQSLADKQFQMHSKLKITLSAIALLQKFLDNQVCVVIRVGPATYQYGYGISQKRDGGMAYWPIPSRHQPCLRKHWDC